MERQIEDLRSSFLLNSYTVACFLRDNSKDILAIMLKLYLVYYFDLFKKQVNGIIL